MGLARPNAHLVGSPFFIDGEAAVTACRYMETTLLGQPQRDGIGSEGLHLIAVREPALW